MLPKNRNPTLPGEILLEEFLNPLNVTQNEFVAHLGQGWTQPKLSAIVNGKRSITVPIALDFADALGTTPEFWLNLQLNVNLWKAQRKRRKISKFPRLRGMLS